MKLCDKCFNVVYDLYIKECIRLDTPPVPKVKTREQMNESVTKLQLTGTPQTIKVGKELSFTLSKDYLGVVCIQIGKRKIKGSKCV